MIACVAILAPGLMLAQTSTPNISSDESNIATQLKQLQNAMGEQQKAIAAQQQRIGEQEQEIEKLREQLSGQLQTVSANTGRPAAHLVNAVLTEPETSPAPALASAALPPAALPAEEGQKESPLSIRIGGAEFTPGGFMDFTSIFRTTNTGNLGTNFFAIPYNNQVAGHLTETRFTAQNSRIILKATDKFGKNDVTGYFEMDFLGNDAANIFVTSNSHTVRERVYFVDLKRDKWEVQAGQMWSWLTPNRVGMSSITDDVFYSKNMDFNYQVGLTWTRAPQFRFSYHPNENWGIGLALENPEQFTGQGAEVIFPSAFNAELATQFDAANNSSTPNLHPDIIPKIAYDTNRDGKHFHAEVAGLLTSVKITDIPVGSVTGAFVKHTKTGGGLEAAVNLEVVKNFHIVANGFWSDGGGRYIFGMGPDAVVHPNAAGTDVDLSLVHSGSGIIGFEAQVTPRTMFSGYYGGAYFRRNAFIDTTSTAATRPVIGFGGVNEVGASTQNRAIQEPTFGWTQTFWKSPQYGALQLITQFSYLTRSPWFIPAGAPKNAHLGMGWVDLRYVLP